MNIVITDGYTLNPGDLNWNEIDSLGNLKLYDRTPVGLINDRCAEADIIITNKTPVNRETINKAHGLKMIAVTATGYNNIDIAAASEKNIIVSNVPAYGTASVAQHVFALLLELTNHTGLHSQSTANGEWQKAKDWSYTLSPVTELSGKTFGVIGLGHIGQQVATIALAFGMKVIYYNPHQKEYGGAKAVSLSDLFKQADIISLHCPLKPDNKKFVNRGLLSLMKPAAYIINTARGQLINESDLAEALNNEIIAGAALDVLSKEPPDENNPLFKAKNCIITPHIAWVSREARQRIMGKTVENIHAFLQGRPINVVSK
jgi:glycerate dehydrogenase